MKDEYQLKRFVTVQKSFYETALQEVKNGNKTSHWMWFIFPQFDGLGGEVLWLINTLLKVKTRRKHI
jgi:uncharacterized protein (DUF1810 family)